MIYYSYDEYEPREEIDLSLPLEEHLFVHSHTFEVGKLALFEVVLGIHSLPRQTEHVTPVLLSARKTT